MTVFFDRLTSLESRWGIFHNIGERMIDVRYIDIRFGYYKIWISWDVFIKGVSDVR